MEGERPRLRIGDRQHLVAAGAVFLRALESEGAQMLVIADREGRCTFAAGATRAMTGLEPDQLMGIDMLAVADDAHASPIAEFFARVLSTPGPASQRLSYLDAGDALRWMDATAVNLLDDPDVEGVIFSCRDVTEGHEAEERSRRLAQVVDSSSDAIFMLDRDMQLTSWNRGAEALLGWDAADVVGQVPHFLSLNGHLRTSVGHIERAFAGIPNEYPTTVRRKGGDPISVSLSLFPVRDADDAIVGVGGMIRDTTSQVETLRALRYRSRQQSAVASLGERALSGVELDVLLATGAELVCETLRCAATNIYELPFGSDVAVLRASYGWGRGPVGTVVALGPGSWLDHVRAAPEPLVSNDLQNERRYPVDAVVLQSGMRSGVTVRLEGRDGLVGAMSAVRDEQRDFTADDVAFLQATANVLAYAIDRSRITDEMRRRAVHDVLTGLPNRVLLIDRLDHALDRAAARNGRVAVLFIDLDRFKRINDTMGHHAGDVVLMEVARRIRSATRPGDTVARLGGDEFTVVCEDVVDEHEAQTVADRIATALSEPFTVAGREVVVTASIGIATGPDRSPDPEELLRDADLAMFRAKQGGRARVDVFDASLRDEATDRLELEQALRQALAQDQLAVCYQPVIALDTGEVIAVEALLRWHHPSWGLVPPDVFIPIAEDAGLIGEIGRWVLGTACADITRLRADRPALRLAVNVSPHQLTEPDIVDGVQAALDTCGLEPSALVLEITETALLDDLADVIDAIAALRTIGVRVAIDDFGTGYSSLTYLTRLTVDEVKVDKSFTAGWGVDDGATAVVAGVIAMARALGLHTVGEGIEQPEQRDGLRALGCDAGQGWLWSGPRPIDDIEAWLTDFSITRM